MTAFPKIDMSEVTRLTREGRLHQAMALLHGAPANTAPSNFEGNSAPEPGRPTSSMPDMVPPSPDTGDAWTAPRFVAKPSTTRARAVTQPQIAEALRGLADRMGQLGSAANLDGLGGPAVARPVPPLPDGARFDERTYANAAGSRAYKLYVSRSCGRI